MSADGALPPGWTWTTLGAVSSRPEYGWTTRAAHTGAVKLLRTTDISGAAIDWASVPFCADTPPDRERYRLSAGDIVISRAGSVGLSALIGDCPEAVFASYLIRFRPFPGVEKRFVQYFLRSPDYWAAIAESAAGIALQNVNARKLEAIRLPLAPLPEQRRIVAELERHFSQLDAAVAALKRAQANLKRYRAAVLKAACEGRLVPTEAELARVEGREYEAGEQLLQRILAELEPRQHANTHPTAEQRGRLELPEGWCWADAGQLADVATGATPLRSNSAYYSGGTIPWVTSGALNSAFVDHAEEHITELAISETNAKVFPASTLLVAMYGEGKTRGKVSELRIPAATNQACAALQFGGIAGETKPYVKLFFQRNYEEIRRLSSGGVQPNLNLSIIRETAIPLPPLAEQRRIVTEVQRLLSDAEQLEAAVAANLKRAQRLRKAILNRAFEGKLVPQDPNDEPARVLLERIRAEREAGGHRVNGRVRAGRNGVAATASGSVARQAVLPGV